MMKKTKFLCTLCTTCIILIVFCTIVAAGDVAQQDTCTVLTDYPVIATSAPPETAQINNGLTVCPTVMLADPACLTHKAMALFCSRLEKNPDATAITHVSDEISARQTTDYVDRNLALSQRFKQTPVSVVISITDAH
ncbi:MAG: hypothetical protein KAS49_04255, partial [Candidatus Cloacimonetes bacterium]|nr:hypothetical protein [Candidatus Cloacimonadota bacterium]